MTDRERIQEGDGDPRHGTANAYINLSCRCTECRAAHSAYWTLRAHIAGRHQPREQHLADVKARAWSKPCGTESKYELGCRCRACTDAAAAGRRRRREKARA